MAPNFAHFNLPSEIRLGIVDCLDQPGPTSYLDKGSPLNRHSSRPPRS